MVNLDEITLKKNAHTRAVINAASQKITKYEINLAIKIHAKTLLMNNEKNLNMSLKKANLNLTLINKGNNIVDVMINNKLEEND